MAWARYIRAKAAAGRNESGTRERDYLEKEVDTHSAGIKCSLTIPASLFTAHPESLLELLPGANLCARLDDIAIPPAVLELMPESVARENLVLPLDRQGRVLLVVAADPRSRDTAEKLKFILNMEIVPVRGDGADILAAINRLYGQTETESVDSVHYIFPIEFDIRPRAPAGYGDEPAAIVQLVNGILRDARSRGADRVVISPVGGVGVRFRGGDEWSAREPLPGRLIGAVAGRVARMVDHRYMFEHSGRATGRFLCRLGPDQFLVRATIETLDEGPVIQLDPAADGTLDFP